MEDIIPGGKGDDSTIETIAKKHNVDVEHIKNQFEVGLKIEHEHSDNDDIATEIALDHLTENPDYYIELVNSGIADEKDALDLFKQLGLGEVKINKTKSQIFDHILNTIIKCKLHEVAVAPKDLNNGDKVKLKYDIYMNNAEADDTFSNKKIFKSSYIYANKGETCTYAGYSNMFYVDSDESKIHLKPEYYEKLK
jgi:hypothetical protein